MQKKAEKTACILIRIRPEVKEKFFRLCREKAINPSELIRKKILEFIEKGGAL